MRLQLHPLINKNSPHYDNEGTNAIAELEKQLNIREMIGFVKGNIFKYNYRKEEKGQIKSDLEKIKTYEAYLEALHDLLGKNWDETLSVARAWEITGKKWRYS